MATLLALALAYAAFQLLPQILAEIVATLIGVRLVSSSQRARKLLLTSAAASGTTAWAWDRRPTKAERRALRQALTAAIDLTTFTSLLPHVAARSYKLSNLIESATNATLGRARG